MSKITLVIFGDSRFKRSYLLKYCSHDILGMHKRFSLLYMFCCYFQILGHEIVYARTSAVPHNIKNKNVLIILYSKNGFTFIILYIILFRYTKYQTLSFLILRKYIEILLLYIIFVFVYLFVSLFFVCLFVCAFV